MPAREAVRDELRSIVDEFVDAAAPDELAHVQAAGLKSALVREATRQQMFATRFGPFFTTARVERALGITRQAVSKKVQQGQILRVTTRDGHQVYPAFQFVGGKVEATISRLVATLREGGMDEWSIVYWLTSPVSELQGSTAVQAVLGTEPPTSVLLELARDDARHWVGSQG